MAYAVHADGTIVVDGAVPLLDPVTERPKFLAIVDRLRSIVAANAARTGVPAAHLFGTVWAETGFLGAIGGEAAVSPPDKDGTSAYGRMQLKPFWFATKTQIGDGVPHTPGDMLHDALNIRFGSDLLALIRRHGNDLVQASSVYNCGGSAADPWRPKPWPSTPPFFLCATKDYLSKVVAANNTYLRMRAPGTPFTSSRGGGGGGGAVLVGAAVIGIGAVLFGGGRR